MMFQKIFRRLSSVQIGLIIFASLLIVSWFLYNQYGESSRNSVSSKKRLNISWFVFRDVNRNGIYDIEDRPYSGFRILLKRPDGSTVFATSNINGFANFKMSANPKQGVITSAGKYQLIAKVPNDWEITSATDTVEIEFRYLAQSPAGIVANSVSDPLGVAPIPGIIGHIDNAPGDHLLFATDSSGKKAGVNIDEDGDFHITGKPGLWFITSINQITGAQQTKDITLQYYPVVLSKSFLEVPYAIPKERVITIGYDNLTASGSVYEIPNGYEGLNWKNWISTHNLYYKGSGYVNSTISPEYVAYNSSGHPGFISRGEPFDFIGTYIGVAWPKASKGLVHLEGYRDDKLVYNDTLKLSERIPVHFYANYLDITSLKIYSDIYWQVILENSQFYLGK